MSANIRRTYCMLVVYCLHCMLQSVDKVVYGKASSKCKNRSFECKNYDRFRTLPKLLIMFAFVQAFNFRIDFNKLAKKLA